jgi:recombination protein RecR
VDHEACRDLEQDTRVPTAINICMTLDDSDRIKRGILIYRVKIMMEPCDLMRNFVTSTHKIDLLVNIPSKLIENAVDQLSSLPGVGRKTALRYALEMLRRKPEDIQRFSQALTEMRTQIKYCKQCHNVSDFEVCEICDSPYRENHTVCVVADIRDVMAIEGTGQYKGKYHVLGGIISPMDGIGPSDLTIDALIERIAQGQIQELILALNATMEGETTSFFISRKLADKDIKISSIARGVAIGGELEYTDEITLGRSIALRTPYEGGLRK